MSSSNEVRQNVSFSASNRKILVRKGGGGSRQNSGERSRMIPDGRDLTPEERKEEDRKGLKIVAASVAFIFICAFMLGLFQRLCLLLVGIVRPLWLTMSSQVENREEDAKRWLMYWVLCAFVLLIDNTVTPSLCNEQTLNRVTGEVAKYSDSFIGAFALTVAKGLTYMFGFLERFSKGANQQLSASTSTQPQ